MLSSFARYSKSRKPLKDRIRGAVVKFLIVSASFFALGIVVYGWRIVSEMHEGYTEGKQYESFIIDKVDCYTEWDNTRRCKPMLKFFNGERKLFLREADFYVADLHIDDSLLIYYIAKKDKIILVKWEELKLLLAGLAFLIVFIVVVCYINRKWRKKDI